MAIISNLGGKLDQALGKSLHPINFAILAEIEQHEQTSVIGELFSKKPTDEYAFSAVNMTSGENFKQVGIMGTPPTTDQQIAYQKVILNDKVWKLEKQLDMITIRDSKKIFELENFGKSFGQEFGRTREEFAAAFFNGSVNSTTFTYDGQSFDCTGADAVSIFSTAHPSIYGTTVQANQSNLYNLPLTYENLFKVEKAMQDLRDDRGHRLGITPDTIVLPNKYRSMQKIMDIVGTTAGKPDTTNYGSNLHCGRYNVIFWTRLDGVTSETDETWYLIDSKRNMIDGLVWLDREELKVEMDRDIRRDAVYYVGSARFTLGAINWRAVAACYPNAGGVGTVL